MQRINSKTEIPVISPEGELIDTRKMVNIPLPILFDEQAVIIDWMADTEKRPTIEQIMTPIEYEGKYWHGYYYWGSAVKVGVTIGVERPFLDKKMIKKAEDGQRVGRWLFAEGHWGGIQGRLRVKVSPVNTMTPWGLIHDGAGFVRKGLINQAYSGLDLIRLGRAKESYTFWQRLAWTDELEQEIEPVLSKAVVDAGDISQLLLQYSPASFDEKREYYELDPKMADHPYIVNAIARSSAQYLARMATTANINTRVGVIIPTQADLCIPSFPDGHKIGVYRHPIDSYSSIQAMENNLDEAEHMNYNISQFTLATDEFFAKGCSREVETDDFDVWLCDEDIKLTRQDLKTMRAKSEIELDGVYVLTQRHKEGTAVGLNIDKAKVTMGADADGDDAYYFDGEIWKAVYKAVQALPDGQTKKLEKSESPPNERPIMIFKSMMNLVGFATKLATDTMLVSDRDFLARELGYPDRARMDEDLNYYIKVGTDGFKSNIDQAQIRKDMSVMQSNMLNMWGKGAPYSSWPNDQAFTHSIPQVWYPGMPDEDTLEAIMPWMDGTVPNIARRVLPGFSNILDEPFKMRALTEYRYWAYKPDLDLLDRARILQDWYNAHAKRINWQDANAIQQFKLEWQEKLRREKYSDRTLANAIWWVSHSSRSENSGAGSVFMGFHEEACRIIKDKPGVNDEGFVTVLVGMHYQVNTDSLEGNMKVVDVPMKHRGKMVVRKAVVANVRGQEQPRDTRYPKNTIALVAINANQPEAGEYWGVVERFSENSHRITLTEARNA